MIEVEAPDGTIVEFPEGTSREVMRVAMQKRFGGMPQAPANRYGKRSQAGSFGMGAAQGVTFGFGDEIGAAIGGLIESMGGPETFAEAYKRNRGNIRQMLDEAEAQNPGSFLGGEIAGGLATAAVPGGAVARGASLGGKMLRGAAAGGIAGGVAGAGAAPEMSDVPAYAGSGAATGAAVGGALAPVASGVGRVAEFVSGRFARKAMAKELGVSPAALSRVQRAAKDDMAADPSMLRNIDDSDMVLNAGENLSGQASALARTPGEASGVVAGAVRRQAEGEGARVKSVIDSVLGEDIGRTATRKLQVQQRQQAGKLMEFAKRQNREHDLGGLDKDIVNAMEAGEGPVAEAMNRLSKMKVFNNADGRGTLSGRASTVQVHNARMAIDDILAKRTGDSALEGNARRAVQDVRKRLDDILKNEVPNWRQADRMYSTARRAEEAFEDGREVLRSSMSPDEVAEAMRGMEPEVRAMYQKGVRDAISRIMGTARNDAGAVARELAEKNWNDEKIAAVVGRGPATQLQNFLKKAIARQSAKNAVTGNSVTAKAQAAQKEFPNPADISIDIDRATGGGLTSIAARAASSIANKASGGAIAKRQNRINADAAKLLTTSGTEARGLLNLVTSNKGAKSAKKKRQIVEGLLNAGILSGNQPLQPGPLFAGTVRPINVAR